MKKDQAAPTEAAGKPEDLMAYKQCVFQLKNARASNPYTQCKARLGINQKSEVEKGVGVVGNKEITATKKLFAHEPGVSFNRLKKKEMTIPKVVAPKPQEVAPTIYPKKVKQVAHKAQIHKPTKDPVPEHVKANKRQMAMKSEIEPGMSYNQLKKMETEEILRKPR